MNIPDTIITKMLKMPVGISIILLFSLTASILGLAYYWDRYTGVKPGQVWVEDEPKNPFNNDIEVKFIVLQTKGKWVQYVRMEPYLDITNTIDSCTISYFKLGLRLSDGGNH